ncbi:SGNH/GDSL hydrolase family protein [Micromonospora trifolii]|uniref:SGNH/GDSL hydrolase family protein n=1 Tax=Micromonospora trifolii TaxID=2911208 RepID=UPI003CEB5C0C
MKRMLTAAAAMAVVSTLLPGPGTAHAAPQESRAPSVRPVEPDRPPATHDDPPDRLADPSRDIGRNWRRSTDRAVTTSSDGSGLHVLVADASDGYRWRTAATLVEPGFPTDQWIGQFCVTGSGRRALVVYAPREFANRDELLSGGAFAAVVDLRSGAVHKLPDRVSLAYHNPGCGAGETAALSRRDTRPDGTFETWAATVDTVRGVRTSAVRTRGQVTSLLPYRDGLAGAMGRAVVRLDRGGRVHELASAEAPPHRLLADGANGLAFQVRRGDHVVLNRLTGGRVSAVRTAQVGTERLRPGAGGTVYVVGTRARSQPRAGLPSGWRAVDAPPDSDVSTTGALVVTSAATGREAAGRAGDAPVGSRPQRVTISARLTGSAKALRFSTVPGDTTVIDAPAGATSTAADPPVDSARVPYDPDRSCAIPRNDSSMQVYQPSAEQVEWAADRAVKSALTFQRPANWKNNGMLAYTPQGTMFPPMPLAGGGSVPAQVLLGILAQESNMWQASWHIVDGSGGNPLTSMGFYGISSGDRLTARQINWNKTDCGYGVGQVTTGMRKVDTNTTVDGLQWTYERQKAVALDYTVNVAASLRILQTKWNTTRNYGLIANNGDPQYIENWWFALWAYNTGFYFPSGSQPWGVGWANNIANTDYPADRAMFLTQPSTVPYGDPPVYDEVGYDNAKHPNHWSYPERVTGFAYTSLRRYDYQDKYWGTTYVTADDRGKLEAQPGHNGLYTFCRYAVNQCDQSMPPHVPAQYPNTKAGACQRDDLKCWWNGPVTWVDCAAKCGKENLRYFSTAPEPTAYNIYPAPRNGDGSCTVEGLPSGARIIDDIDVLSATGPEGCRPTYTKGGTFGLTFGAMGGPNGATIYPSKVDFHQSSHGFGGHVWFAHTMQRNDPDDGLTNDPLKVTGTWTINPTGAWTRVFVHIPDAAAWTRQADYAITAPGIATKHRVLPTRLEANTWVPLGVFDFRGSGTPKVELTNITRDGNYSSDVAFDAIAVQSLSAKPGHFVVGLGDSFSSGEGAGYYSRVSDQYGNDSALRNACHRSSKAWSRQIRIPGTPNNRTIGELSDGNDPNLDFHFAACSGAVTANLMLSQNGSASPPASGGTIRGQFGELTQLDQGWLDENTTLVVLTIGGNDLKWTDALIACATASNCAAPGFVRQGDPKPLRDMITDRINGSVKQDTQRVIREIRSKAANAMIMLAGYPQVFVSGGQYQVPDYRPLPDIGGVGFSADEVAFLNEMTGKFVITIGSTFDLAVKTNYVDVRGDFANHELGVPFLNEGYFNALWVPGEYYTQPGDDDEDGEPPTSKNSPHSGHPNVAGFAAYGRALSNRLLPIGYTW